MLDSKLEPGLAVHPEFARLDGGVCDHHELAVFSVRAQHLDPDHLSHTHPDSKLIQTALLLGASIIIHVRERTLFFSTEHLTPTRDSVSDL